MSYVRIPSDPGPGGGGGGGGGGSGGPAFRAGSAGGGNPDSGIGVDGDYYLDSDNGTLWFKDAGEYGNAAYQFPTVEGPLYRYQALGTAVWSQASTVLTTIPGLFNGNSPSTGLALTSIVAYRAIGTQPANFTLKFGSTTVLPSTATTGLSATTFSTFTAPAGSALGQPGQDIIIAPVGGLVSGGGICSIELIGVLR